MNIAQLFRILAARWMLVATLFLVTVGATLAASLLLPKRYVANTAVIVDVKSTDPVLGGTVLPPSTMTGYLATQVDVIKSDRVLNKVIQATGVDKDPAWMEEWQKSAKGRGEFRSWLGQALLKNLDVDPSREGSTINLAYEAGDPNTAARVVNAFAQAYIDTALELKIEPAKNYALWFETKTKAYREELERAQAKLSAFQQASGITASDERFDIENARLSELSTQLVNVQAQLSEARSRQDALRQQGRESMSEVVQNPLIQSLKNEIAKSEARVQELQTRLGSNHPQLLAAQSELAGLKSRLDSEIGKVTGSILSSRGINAQREAETRAALEAQRSKVLKLKRERDQLAVLQREVDNAQKSLDLVNQRLTATNLESQARQSEVSILTPAVPPPYASRPKVALNTVIGAIAGLFLGIIAALTMDRVQRPLRTAEDLLQSIDVPVLAVLPPASSRRPQRLIGLTGPTVSPSALRLGSQ